MDAIDLIKSLQRQACEEGAVHIWGLDDDRRGGPLSQFNEVKGLRGSRRCRWGQCSISTHTQTVERSSGSVAAAAEKALASAQTAAEASMQMASAIADIASQFSSSRALTLEAGYDLERRAIDHCQAFGDCNQGRHRHSSDQ